MRVDPDALPAVRVEIDRVSWAPVTDLADSRPADRHFVAAVDPVSGATSIVFGDGVAGARPPIGMALVCARYRSGAGVRGNRPGDSGGALRDLLEVLSRQMDVLEEDLRRLYEDQLVETADGWQIPYLGEDGHVLGHWTFSRARHRKCLCFDTVSAEQRRES
jgi:hypothetical protein